MFQKLQSFLRYFGIPVGVTFLYVVFCIVLSTVISGSDVIPMVLGDGIGAILVGILFYHLCVKSVSKENRKLFRFNGMSLFLLSCLFLFQYVFGQAASSWVGLHFPSEYINTYREMSNTDLMIYLMLSITLAPITEELLFRGIWYKFLRQRFSMIFCFFVSSIGFGLIHGTTEHLPITFALSMFICFVYEITGNMLYCILIHMLANLISITYIVRIPVSYTVCLVLFLIYVAFMFILFAAVDVLREKMRFHPEQPTLTDRLEEKKKHWGDNADYRDEK